MEEAFEFAADHVHEHDYWESGVSPKLAIDLSTGLAEIQGDDTWYEGVAPKLTTPAQISAWIQRNFIPSYTKCNSMASQAKQYMKRQLNKKWDQMDINGLRRMTNLLQAAQLLKKSRRKEDFNILNLTHELYPDEYDNIGLSITTDELVADGTLSLTHIVFVEVESDAFVDEFDFRQYK